MSWTFIILKTSCLWEINFVPTTCLVLLKTKENVLVFDFYPKIIFLGHDVIAQAQSGTGKTATFVISILQRIDMNLKGTQALILAPTRELAQQVSSMNSQNFILKLNTCVLYLYSLTVLYINVSHQMGGGWGCDIFV